MIYWIGGILLLCLLFLNGKEKSPLDALFGNAGDFLSIFNCGFCIRGGWQALSREQSFKNALAIGSTGSFKSSAVLVGSLFTLTRKKCSIIVLDVSSEIFKLTSGFLSKKRKRKIFCFDLSPNSDGFNPIQLCKDITDLDKVAHVLITNSGVDSKGDPFWHTSSEMILSLFMQYVFFYERNEFKNMANVVLLLETYMTEPDKIDKLFVKTKDERLLRHYRTMNAIPEKTRLSVLITAVTATKLFKSPAVARCTSVSTFDVETFRKESCVLYLCIPLNMISFLSPLTAVMFEMLFQESLSSIPKRKANPLFFLIDEMMTMKLNLGLVFSNCRKYLVGCLGVLQSEGMLQMKYSKAEAEAIKQNACARIYLPGQNIETCRELQEIIGKCLIKDENGKERYAYGLEASQIRTGQEAIILINSALPIRQNVKPYFNHLIYNSRTKITPYEPTRKIDYDEVPLLKLN